MIKQEEQKGVVLYIVLLILSIFTTVILTLTSVSVSQTKIAWQAGESVKAFSGADSGVERALYNIRKLEDFANISITYLSNGESYVVNLVYTSTTATIKSNGAYKTARRTIEAKY